MFPFTCKAIRRSCVWLPQERPVDEITVRDIVEGRGRNPVCDPFAGPPSLINAIMREEVDQIIQEKPDGVSPPDSRFFMNARNSFMFSDGAPA